MWKHLPLAALLADTRPALYAETHAGNAVYRPTPTAAIPLWGDHWALSVTNSPQTGRRAPLWGEIDRYP